MTRIRPLGVVDDITGLKALARACLAHELAQLKQVSGLARALEPLLAGTFDHMDRYMPPRGAIRVAEDDAARLIGCVFLKTIRGNAAEIKRLYVRPEARGAGLGRQLMDAALQDARRLGAARVLLDTGIYDTAAHRLYEALGFRHIAPYPESENDPELAPYLYYMACELDTDRAR